MSRPGVSSPLGERFRKILERRPEYKSLRDTAISINVPAQQFTDFAAGMDSRMSLFWRYAFFLQFTPEELAEMFAAPNGESELAYLMEKKGPGGDLAHFRKKPGPPSGRKQKKTGP